MALKDQPYLPLYIQDVLTDEKLIECSAESHGIYFRLLCVLHKQEIYGLLCLKQKYKQNESKLFCFAQMLAKQMPFKTETIRASLEELVAEDVLQIDGDNLFQKRMVKDGEISIIRTNVGKLGGSSLTKQYGKSGFLYLMSDGYKRSKLGISCNPKNRLYRLRSDLKLPKHFVIKEEIPVDDMGDAEDFAINYFGNDMDGEWIILDFKTIEKEFVLLKAKYQARMQPNAENANDINNSVFKEKNYSKNLEDMIVREMMDVWMKYKPKYKSDVGLDYTACLDIAYFIAADLGIERSKVIFKDGRTNLNELLIVQNWEEVVKFILGDGFFDTLTISGISNKKNWHSIQNKIIYKPKDSKVQLSEKKRVLPQNYFEK